MFGLVRVYDSGMSDSARFSVGEIIHHRLFDYRGVIYDVDPQFMLSEEWYASVALSRPPKDQPWYRVLVHGGDQETYVAEQNLESDPSREPVEHPLTGEYFGSFESGRYTARDRAN